MKKHHILELFNHLSVLSIRVCPVLSVIIAFFGTGFELDPFFFVFNVFIPNHILQNYSFTIAPVRFILSAICILEFVRIAAFAYVVVSGLVDFILTIMGNSTGDKLSFGTALRVYAMAQVVIRSTHALCDLAMSSFISSLMGATIIALYLSISAYALIPFTIYWLFPCIAVCCVCFVQILLISFIYLCEQSATIIQKLKVRPVRVPQFETANPFNLRKLMRRKINAMRPFTFNPGLFDYRFHQFGKRTKIAIIENICNFTVSALLAKRD